MSFNSNGMRFTTSGKKNKKVGYYSTSLFSFVVVDQDDEESSIIKSLLHLKRKESCN